MADHEPLEMDCRDVHAARQAQAPMVLVDCREADEYALVHLLGAKLLPMSEMATRVDELRPYENMPIIVYCHLGQRSLAVAEWLRTQGFPTARSMSGGIDAWATVIDETLPRY